MKVQVVIRQDVIFNGRDFGLKVQTETFEQLNTLEVDPDIEAVDESDTTEAKH